MILAQRGRAVEPFPCRPAISVGIAAGPTSTFRAVAGRAMALVCLEEMRADGMDGDDRVVKVSDSVIRNELAQLRQEHRDLDGAIEALHAKVRPDTLQIQRLKKRKLYLKDRISALEDKLLPDIIA